MVHQKEIDKATTKLEWGWKIIEEKILSLYDICSFCLVECSGLFEQLIFWMNLPKLHTKFDPKLILIESEVNNLSNNNQPIMVKDYYWENEKWVPSLHKPKFWKNHFLFESYPRMYEMKDTDFCDMCYFFVMLKMPLVKFLFLF